MYQKLFRFAVTILTILTANLLTTFLADTLVSYKWDVKPLRFSLIAMAVITLVFYPLFTQLEGWVNTLSRKFMRAGNSLLGSYIGLLLMFLFGIFILLYFYADMWYGINIFKLIWKGRFFDSL